MEQLDDVLPPAAQGRDRDFQHVEAVEQILPEASGGDELVEVDVGRRDDAHVHGDHPVVADAPDFVLLEHAQELALHVQRDFGYFIEEQRPVVGHFKKPHLAAARRPGECAFHIAEEFAFKQVFGQGRAVDGYEGPVAALAGVVDALREQLLARPRLAHDQDVGRGRGVAAGILYGLVDEPAAMYDVRKLVLGGQPPVAQFLADMPFELLDFVHVLEADDDARRDPVDGYRRTVEGDGHAAHLADFALYFRTVAHRPGEAVHHAGEGRFEGHVLERGVAHEAGGGVVPPDDSGGVHVEKAVLHRLRDDFIGLGLDALVLDKGDRPDGFLQRLRIGFPARAQQDGGKAQKPSVLLYGIAADDDVAAVLLGQLQRVPDFRRAFRDVDADAAAEHAGKLFDAVERVVKADETDAARLETALALLNGADDVVTGNGDVDDGDAQPLRLQPPGGIAAGDDGVAVAQLREVEPVHGCGDDTVVDAPALGMGRDDVLHDPFHLRVRGNADDADLRQRHSPARLFECPEGLSAATMPPERALPEGPPSKAAARSCRLGLPSGDGAGNRAGNPAHGTPADRPECLRRGRTRTRRKPAARIRASSTPFPQGEPVTGRSARPNRLISNA